MAAPVAQSQTPAAAPAVRIAPPDCAEEREADRIADAIMRGDRTPADRGPSDRGAIHRKCTACASDGPACPDCAEDESETLMLARAGHAAEPGAPAAAAELRGGGRPLPETVRAYFEPRFGQPLSDVRIHDDPAAGSAARAINARAYALGRHIAFARGAFAPGTEPGRRLLAHELAHATRRDATTGVDVLHRDEDAPEPPGPAPTFGQPTIGPAPEESEERSGETRDVTMVHDRVDRILVSCEQMRIAFVTNSATYLYRLTTCNRGIPTGTYIAKVTRNREENTITFDLKAQEAGAAPESESDAAYDATFRWAIRSGQVDPVDLFAEQDSVLVDYGTEVPQPTRGRRQECLVTIAPREVIEGNAGRVDLTEQLPLTSLSVEWDIAEFGLGDIEIELVAGVEAFVDWHHGDGTLRDICLSSSDGSGGYGGRAAFDIEGGAELHLILTADLHAGLEVGGIIDLVEAGGSLKLEGIAEVAGRIDTLVEIGWNRMNRDQPFTLGTSIQLAAASQLALHLQAAASLSVLGFDLLSAEWPDLLEVRRPFAWTGGLTFGESFVPGAELASVEHATQAQLRAAPQSGPLTRRRRRRRGIPIREMIEAALGVGEGELDIDGSSCEKALPISWLKPASLYEDQLSFDPAVNPGVTPTTVGRQAGPTLVSHDTVRPPRHAAIVGPTPIGVTEKNWPENGAWSRCFRYVRPASTSRLESEVFRHLARGLGHDVSGVQVDHIRELQFGGKDQFDNLWTLDSRANMSAGALHRAQIRAYRAIFGNLEGKHMRISSIGLDANFDIPPGLRSAEGEPEDELL